MASATLYMDTGGSSTNSGTTDTNSATLSGSAATAVTTVITLDGSPDLSGIAVDGSQAIYLSQASNSNQKIFFITASDNTLKTVTVSVAPSGITSSAWTIGGRMVYTSANFESALRAGDTIIFNNSPASKSGGSFLTLRNAGDSTSGFITVKGKTGLRPVLQITDTNNVLSGSAAHWKFENLEFAQSGASGDVISASGGGHVFVNIKISDGGGFGFTTGNGARFALSEISGVSSSGIRYTGIDQGFTVYGCYIHDVGSAGYLNGSGGGGTLLYNIFDTCTTTGINFGNDSYGGTNRLVIVIGNIVYKCGTHGINQTAGDLGNLWFNNIVSENGNTSGEYNINFSSESDQINSYHDYNCLYTAGSGGAANYQNFTLSTNEITTNPLFIDPDNGDFRLSYSSPCKGTGFPGTYLGGPTGSMDMGSMQRVENQGNTSGSGGTKIRRYY